MDKGAIKKYAVWARRELLSRVTQRALRYGISEKEIIPAKETSVRGVVLSPEEIAQRTALINQIHVKGFEPVIEEVAYTWFNRFCALRYMEVNGYLPTHIRVFTDDENHFRPQIMAEAINLDLDGLDMEKVYAMKDANDTDALFKYLIITQCNALSSILPGMFQKINDYTELLFPDNLLRDGSAIEQMISMIGEEEWKDAVQIIGWLYQYYNTEPKDKVFANLKKNIKISKENIPAATQLFTPDWIVRYMVENSLGRLWIEGHPAAKEQLLPTKTEQDAYIVGMRNEDDHKWHYYLEEAKQEPEVQEKLSEIRKEYSALTPEQIRCMDPCMGSGHILAYMFDVLMQIYESYGYTAREAASSIVENNLYGLDIDDRAAQLAYFVVMMKARQYDRRFFSRGIQPHVYAIKESNGIGGAYPYEMGNFLLSKEHQETLNYLFEVFKDAKEYGSILSLEDRDYKGLLEAWKYTASQTTENFNLTLWYDAVQSTIPPLIEQAVALSQKYDVVVTNPPYMGGRNMNAKLLNTIVSNYPEGKADLFSAFILRTNEMTFKNGFTSLITQHSWMFLSSFERLREYFLSCNLINMGHLGARAFEEISGEVVQTTTWVARKCNIRKYQGVYIRLVSYESQDSKEYHFLNKTAPLYQVAQSQYDNIPGKAFAYWLGNPKVFIQGNLLEQVANPRQGMKTLDNDYYIRFWYEVNKERMHLVAKNAEEAQSSKCKWFPINHGGEYRKYYGNNYTIVNWFNNGEEMKSNAIRKYNCITRTITNIGYYFKPGITWSVICSAPSFRWYGNGFLFSNGGQCIVPDNDLELGYIIGILNSKVTEYLLNILSPTLGFESGYLKKMPIICDTDKKQCIEILTSENIKLCKQDWDSFEVSWDFQQHPLIRYAPFTIKEMEKDANYHITDMNYIRDAYTNWSNECDSCFNQLKSNEEELNRIFIDIYGLQDELTPEVNDKNVTVRKADLQRDIKSLISYAVGCMFGRYSLDIPGLIYAGGDWNKVSYSEDGREGIRECTDKYASFPADKDNIIPISDDEYFEDDMANRFESFIRIVYGKETLEDNLKFIADALGGKGQPKEVIRDYFLNGFYADHLKIYQKRPIYWLFDSGKKNGFKCLIYMHRYQPDTIARIRTDYVHEQQSRYRTAIEDLEKRIVSAATSERVKLNKQLKKLQEQADELHIYEEKIHHLADQYIAIDLDDGVKMNYAKFQEVLAKIR